MVQDKVYEIFREIKHYRSVLRNSNILFTVSNLAKRAPMMMMKLGDWSMFIKQLSIL